MEEAKERFQKLLEKAEQQNVNIWDLQAVQKNQKYYSFKRKHKILFMIFVAICVYSKYKYLFDDEECHVLMPSELAKVFRPPESCDYCKDITSIPRLSNLLPEEFEAEFAYSGRPVIISDATTNWTALEVFNFWYFKNIYEMLDKRNTLKCQFFPYKTSFKNLFEAFTMNKERAEYQSGIEPWYFGWSNCNQDVAKILRQHYDRPYFLPELSENKAIDWIFMGGRGLGAHMHVDNVKLPSWQAQLKGTKEWILAPPPECYYVCKKFSVIVQPGDIIVLDTNRWYHKTNVISQEISITIGAEYD